MNLIVENSQNHLKLHPMYMELNSLEKVRIFMQYHVFAVWDFMSLLKSLQKEITCTEIPWIDSKYSPELVRLINEIVLGEESDTDQDGNPMSHFQLYMNAMEEIGADTFLIRNFLQDIDLNKLPNELREVVSFHLDIALNKKVHEVAASFFYGREKLIPEMFQSIVDVLEDNKMNCPSLIYYLKRHIEVDGDEHGPMAQKCLEGLLDTQEKRKEAIECAVSSLKKRVELWDFIQTRIS